MSELLKEFIAEPKIAYFSMEIGLKNEIPTYSGGLGILAGDTIRSSADLNLPIVAVTLVSKKGYFRQDIDERGHQIEYPDEWQPLRFMTLLPHRVKVRIENRDVYVQVWLYVVESPTGGKVPVLFLDTDVEGNTEEDKGITSFLYGGDERYRLKQEIILGIGGGRILNALGFQIKRYHMNEGHAAFLTLELLLKYKKDIETVWDERLVWDVERVRSMCIFTTHTPVEAGHDKFSYEMVKEILGEIIPLYLLKGLAGEAHLNMTMLSLNLSKYVNGVAKRHRDISRNVFSGYEIHAITNGVHSYTWTSESFKRIYDKYLPGWANEPELFVRIGRIPDEEIWNAHMEAKRDLIHSVKEMTEIEMDHDTLTIGFARRATAYKRADLLFYDLERLRRINRKGQIQIVYAGKAHPRDYTGKLLMEKIFGYIEELKGEIKIAYLKNYDMDIALKMVTGVDLWLNTPARPWEASGTSGMKAAHNGVVNFSVLDGWWIEGHIEGFTGWSIGPAPSDINITENVDRMDADDLYHKLENIIIPTFYNNREIWIRMMQNAIGKNAYYFNSHRMMRRYVTEAYFK
jgi:starch phosphorylase